MPTATLHTTISMSGSNGQGTETIYHTIPGNLPISGIKIEGSGNFEIHNYNNQNITSATLTITANNVQIYKQTFTNLGSAPTITRTFSLNVTLTNSALYHSTLNFVAFLNASKPMTNFTFNGDIYRTVTLGHIAVGSLISSRFLDEAWALYKMSNVTWSHVGSALTYPADTDWTSGAYTATMRPAGDGTTVQAKALNALIDTICTQTSNRHW